MTFVKKYVWLVVIVSLFACKQGNKNANIPVNDFFKSQDKANYRISPNGKSISYLKLQDKKQNLFVEDIESGNAVQLTKLQEKNINFYAWVSDDELIYYKEKEGQRFQSDLFIISKDGKNEKQLSKNEKSRIRVLEDQLIDNKYLLVLSNKRDSTVSDVYRLNVRDGKMEIAAQNPGNITKWVTDTRGKLRMAMSNDGVNETLWYRENENNKFKPLITNNFRTTIVPVAFSEKNPNLVYAISNLNRDKNALIELDCKTGKEKSVLFANDSLNVVDAQYSRTKGKMTYVVYETWKKKKHFLDEEAKFLNHKLDLLLPNTESQIIDRDKNENVFVVRTFTDRNPGSYYLYIADSGVLKKLSDINSDIKVDAMSEMKPFSFEARDGLEINGYLTIPLNSNGKNIPIVVVPNNSPLTRNSWGYNAEVQFLANRGYGVLQVNYRGSSGYGKSFYAAGFKQWGTKIQDDIDDGVKSLIAKGIANPQKIAIYGQGLGGFIALNAAIRRPQLYKCVASNSGVLNLLSYIKSIPPFYKSNLKMYYEIVGDPDTDIDYMKQASPIFHAEKVNIPVFITQNAKDPRVNPNDAIQFVKELKKKSVPYTYIEKQNTQFLNDREEVRLKVYAGLEQFLESNLKKK